MFTIFVRNFSKKAGWCWLRNRKGRTKIVSITYPPKERSKIIKLNDESDKLVFVCNGKLRNTFLNVVKNLKDTKCVIQNNTITTPCVIISKAKSHTLLEILTYDEILHIEKLKKNIIQKFEEAEKRLAQDKQNDILKKHQAVKFTLIK